MQQEHTILRMVIDTVPGQVITLHSADAGDLVYIQPDSEGQFTCR